MTRTRELCENCGKRRVVDLFYAMITQELVSELCCCDVTPEFVETAKSEPVIVCRNCSKRVLDKEDDSTQWIFRRGFCSCTASEPYQLDAIMVGDLVQQLVHQNKKRKDKPSKGEPEIQVDARKFPIEAYKPLKMIDGSGGRLFKCRDRQLGTLVSVKILKSPQPDQIMQLKQEAQTESELDHDNILKVLGFGIIREMYPFMVTEYLDGETLHSFIEKSDHVQIYTAVNIISQVCDGLIHALSKGVFHWNLTPNKILLINPTKAVPDVKLTDFGFALNTVTDGTFENREGLTLVGTAGYMSPEQAMGQRVDVRAPVYSIGCILFELLTGELPFKGKTPTNVLTQQLEKPVPKLKEVNRQEFPHQLERIVSRCLQKDKEERYASVDHLKRAIKQFASQPSVVPEAIPEPAWKTAIQEHKILICVVLIGMLAGSAWATYSWLSTESAFNVLGKSAGMDSFLANSGSDFAKVQLGRKYLDGNGVPQDRPKAVALFSEAAEHNFAPAQFWLGYCYIRGFARLHKTVESSANAITSITQLSERDLENYAHAFSLISQAAEKGYPTAEKYMGLMIRIGMDRTGQITPPTSKGRTKRLADSTAWLKKAADQGDPEATNYLAIEKAVEFGWSKDSYAGAFDYSNQFAKEKEEVFKLFQEAAKAGQPDAQYNLGLCYELGVGTGADNELAKKWYLPAAEYGLPDAQFRLGFLLELEKSADALQWYKKAALQNYLYAEIALCRVYQEGFCIPANLPQAQYWYDKVRERPDRFYTAPSELSSEPINLQQSQEKIIASMDRVCKEHLEMPHLLIQKWGPSGIKCWPRGPMRDIDLMQLSTMKDVTFLDLFGMVIHDRGTKFVPGLPLTFMRLSHQDISPSGYANIAKLNSLKAIELSGDVKTDGLGQLNNCRNLIFVGLTGLITQETVNQLAAIKSLKNIAFHCRQDVSLAPWGNLPNLESLRLDEATQKTVNSLSAMKNIKFLAIASFKEKDPSDKLDLAPLIKLPKLEKLSISQSFNQHIVSQLKALPKLKKLSITSTKGVSDADLYLLKQIPAKDIEIFLDADCQITDKGLMILGSIPNVTHVNISVSPVTPGGVKAFREKFPSHFVKYSENGKEVKEKKTDHVEDQVEKQIKKQIEDQIAEQQKKEQAKAAAKQQQH